MDNFDPVAAATPRGMFLLTGGVPEEDPSKVSRSCSSVLGANDAAAPTP